MKYYAVEFELKEEVKGTPDAEEFMPILVCCLEELHEILDIQINHYDIVMVDIVNIRPATDDEILNCPHFYI
jgi:SepF-like predicted cell division protein (DUF552 family)